MKLAAIDIGSNAVRLQVVRTMEEDARTKFRKIEFVRIPIRLGDDAFRDHCISRPKKEMFYKAMQSFWLLMDLYGVDYYMACATSAMREAENGARIIRKVEKDIGLSIEIISGKRESELILGSIRDFFEVKGNYLSIDVGGGSTEMAVISDRRVVNSISFDIGTVRMVDGAVKNKTWQTIEHWVRHKTEGLENMQAVVTSGTISKIFRLLGNEAQGPIYSRNQLKEFHRKVSKMSLQERIDTYRLNPDRADIIETSADIYLRILSWAGITQILSPENAGLKDGILNELYDTYCL